MEEYSLPSNHSSGVAAVYREGINTMMESDGGSLRNEASFIAAEILQAAAVLEHASDAALVACLGQVSQEDKIPAEAHVFHDLQEALDTVRKAVDRLRPDVLVSIDAVLQGTSRPIIKY